MVVLLNKKNLDEKYLKIIENIDFIPIFILGLPRSGTSILYKTLTKTNSFNAVTSYHIINYNQLLYNHIQNLKDRIKEKLNESFKEKELIDRGMDRLEISADFPEEYGYILQKYSRQLYIVPDNLHIFMQLAKKIQFLSENNKPLLLKNPFDFQNTAYIKKVLPNAQFIFICRDPVKIFSSNMKAIRFLLKGKNPYSIQIFRAYNKLFQNPLLLHTVRLFFSQLSIFGLIYVVTLYKRLMNRFMKNIKQLSSKDYTIVKYEDFCNLPQQTVENIMKFFDLKSEEKINVKQFIIPRKTFVEPDIIKMKNFIYKQMKNYYDFFGYKPGNNKN